jgi:carboxypeptidase C (cathepsin A)
MLDNDRYQLMPWVLRLPTMAAGARLHGRWSPPADSPPGAALAEVERFALQDLLSGLAEGAAMAPAAQRRLYAEEARYAGLPEDTVARAAGRITIGRYAKELLRDQTRIVSPYDVSIDTPDPSPGSDSLRGAGSRLTLVSSLLTAAFVSYARSDLQVRTDLPYVVLNNQTNRHWSWSGEEGGGRSPAGAADDLAHALVTEPGLVALIAHGVYDLVTPYLASRFLVDQMALDPAARSRIELERYEGGHMFYTHAQALDAFSADVRALFARAVPAAQAAAPAGGSEH